MAYLLEPLQSLCRELVLLAVLLEVGHQLGEDALELLQSGGHVDGMAGQVDGSKCCCCLGAGYEASWCTVVFD